MLALKQEELFEEIELLPIDLKTKIVDKILSSITPQSENIEALWKAEANRRKSEVEDGTQTLIDGNKVFEKIATRLQS